MPIAVSMYVVMILYINQMLKNVNFNQIIARSLESSIRFQMNCYFSV